MMANPPVFAGRLRIRRAEADLTQGQLAVRSGLSRSTIVELESGKRRRPHLRTVRRLAEALGCPLRELLEDAS